LRSKIFAELFRKAARNDGTGQSKQPRCALRRGAPAHHVCARRLRIFLAERSYASTRNLGMVRAQGHSSAWTARITNIRARPHEADRVLASARNVGCGWRTGSQTAIGIWKRPRPPTSTGVCRKRKVPVRVDEATMSSSARTHQANGSSTFTPAILKSRVFRVTTMKP